MARLFRSSLAAAACVLLPCVLLSAQERDALAERLGLSAEKNALPIWTNPADSAKLRMGKFVRQRGGGVVIVGNPKHGYGTAFVISAKHRLIATNAHVADIAKSAEKVIAIPNGTAQSYAVEKVWYHPGVLRQLKGQRSLVIRSSDPADGPVEPSCPDLAVLQLSVEGPDLEFEVELATPDELESLLAQPVGLLGFPAHDYNAWPSIGSEAAATYHDGVVSRLTDFTLNGGAPGEDKQFVQYTMSTWNGFSGSPVFLPNGHVVAVHNMSRFHQGAAGQVKSIAHGVRIDCLWELLVHHQLDDRVPPKAERSNVRVARWLERDEKAEKFREAVRLTAEAVYWIDVRGEFSEGVQKASEAIKLAPQFPVPYQIRYHGYLNYVFQNHRRIPRETSLAQLAYARADAEKYIRLAPSDPQGLIYLGLVLNNTAYLTQERELFRQTQEIALKLLAAASLSTEMRAKAYSLRGLAASNLGDSDRALADHNEALRLSPNDPSLWETRGDYWRNLGREDLAQADDQKARELRAKPAGPNR